MAIHYFKKAGQQRYSDALYMLGSCYYEGDGVIRDFQKAFGYFYSVAKERDEAALHAVGVCYQKGHGVPLNLSRAVQYFKRSS
jgi:TPR repeat protein